VVIQHPLKYQSLVGALKTSMPLFQAIATVGFIAEVYFAPDFISSHSGRTVKLLLMSSPRYTTQLVTWQAAETQLRAVRTEVFIHEQHIPEALEWDGKDPHAIHALATEFSGNPIGTGRLLLHGELAHIGRMAVLPAWRGKGVGASLLLCLLDEARQRGAGSAFLNAQTVAVPFYERFNFVREGTEFLEEGIPHYRMTLTLV